MFDLERRIGEWRRSMATSVGDRGEVLDELESHLREELQRLDREGQSPEQAWEKAVTRLGNPHSLAAEFAKVTPALPVPWLPARVLVLTWLILAGCLGGILGTKWQEGRIGALLATHVGAITLGYSATFLVGALAICHVMTRLYVPLSSGQHESLRRVCLQLAMVAALFTVLGTALGAFWAKEHWGRFWSWDAREIGAAAVLVWNGLTIVALERRAGERMETLVGLGGNVVVALAWFGAGMGVGPLLVLFVVSQVALFGLGVVPAETLRRNRA